MISSPGPNFPQTEARCRCSCPAHADIRAWQQNYAQSLQHPFQDRNGCCREYRKVQPVLLSEWPGVALLDRETELSWVKWLYIDKNRRRGTKLVFFPKGHLTLDFGKAIPLDRVPDQHERSLGQWRKKWRRVTKAVQIFSTNPARLVAPRNDQKLLLKRPLQVTAAAQSTGQRPSKRW